MEIIYNSDTLDYMYRYLLKYVGTYRVKAEYDLGTGDFPRDENGNIDKSFDDFYIPCKSGVIKHTYIGNDILVCCFYNKIKTANNVFERIQKKYPKIEIELEDSSPDGFIYFNAKDMRKIATIINPSTTGKGINPFSKKNLPSPKYQIPSADLTNLYKLTKDLSRKDTMLFFKKVNKEFLTSVSTNKKDYLKELTKLNMPSKEFIHYKKLWPEYIEFVKDSLKKY